MKNTHILLSIFLSLFLISGIQAQDKAFHSTIDRDTVYLGDAIIMTISIENIKADLNFPDLDSCHVTQPSQRSNIQITNGKMTSSKEYDYRIIPLNIGAFTIPEIILNDGEEEFRSEAVNITVLPNPKFPELESLDKVDDYPTESPEKPKKKKKTDLPPGTKIIRT